MHLAIVVDEYGVPAGWHLCERGIVGEISDEFDDEDLVFSKLDDQNFVFEGKHPWRILQGHQTGKIQNFLKMPRGSRDPGRFILEVTKGFPKKTKY